MTLHSKTSLQAADAVDTLATQSTLDRSLVHRAAVSEVFLTDIRRTGEATTFAAAQIPGCHGFFNDHRSETDVVDTMLLLEIARQATLSSAHVLDVTQDTILISRNFEITLLGDPIPYSDQKPLEITIESDFEWQTFRGKRPRSGLCRQTIYLDGQPIAKHWSDGQLLGREQLAYLREAQRGTPPSWTNQQPPRNEDTLLAPSAVQRWDPRNVVLSNLVSLDENLTAKITPHWQNRALFDHCYDHLTMQLLTEAARQTATLAKGSETCGFESCAVQSISGCFHQFAELDAETYAKIGADSGPDLHRITIDQGSEIIAEINIEFASNLALEIAQ